MKKTLIVVFLVLVVVFSFTIVNAEDNFIQKNESEIPNNSYVIGTHLYTTKSVLTLQRIMLAAKTIEGDNNNPDAMKIFYKDIYGNWIETNSGQSQNLSGKVFNISLIDDKKVE